MSESTLGHPALSTMQAAKDHYHAVASINTFGAIQHANAYAKVLIRTGEVSSEAEAVRLANAAVENTVRIAEKNLLAHKLAHEDLKADAAQRKLQVRRAKPTPSPFTA